MSPANADKKKCYHIFPMLLHAVEASRLASYGVSDKVKDMYLGGGRRSSVVASVPFSYTAKSPDELCADFHYLKETLLFAGLAEGRWNEVVESLIVIVLLQGVAVVGTDTAIIANASQTLIHAAEKILGVRDGSLLNMFLRYTSGRLGTLDHTPASAKGAINAVCGNIYRRIFSHIGKQLCGSSFISTADEHSGEDVKDNDLYLELIDPLGYEQRWLMGSYPAGNLYTLAKNYCGEAFVQHYSATIFDNVIQSYAEDSVFLSGFTAPSTQNYIELLELPKKGLIGIIEEVSNSMRPDEKAILDKSFQEFAKSKMIKAAGTKSKKTEFIVRHHFGEALYDVEGFVTMNKSPLASKTEANEVLDTSKLGVISSEKKEEDGTEDDSVEGQKKPGKLSNRFGQSKNFMLNQFKASLNQTFKDMASEGNGFHYLLCIKPSEDLEGSTFDARFVEPQLDNGMLPEILQLNKVGYPCRLSMGTFYEKYKTILHIFHRDDSLLENEEVAVQVKREHNEKLLTSILATLELPPEDLSQYQQGGANAPEYGKENVYLRLPLQKLLDTLLSFKMITYNSMVIRIQSLVRKEQAHKSFISMKRMSILMAALARKKAATKKFVRVRYLVSKLTANVKRNIARRKFVAMKAAVNIIKRKLIGSGFYKDRLRYLITKKNIRSIHMLVRSHLLRRQTDRIVSKMHILQNAGRYYLFKKKWLNKKNHNATVIQRHFRGHYERHYRNKDAVIYIYNKRRLRIATKVTRQIQRHFRVRMIRRRFQQLRAATRVLQHWLRGRRGRIRFLKIIKVTAWLQKHTRRILAADRFTYLLANAMMLEEKKRMKILRDEEISRAHRCNLYIDDMDDMVTTTTISMAAMGNVPAKSSYEPVYLTSPTTPMREKEGKDLPLLVMGSQLLRDGRTVAYESLAGFDLYSDISATYPKGLLLTLLTLHAEFNALNVFVSKIRLGSNHCLVVDDHNHIYGFGLGDHGEFGNGTKKSHTSPKLLDTLTKCIARDEMALMNVHNGLDTTINLKNVVVKELFCGREHSILLSDTGFVWTWGKNNRGQLGHNNFQTSYYPRLVHVQTTTKTTNTDSNQVWKLGKDADMFKTSPLRNVKSVGCGAYFCGVINDQGLVYTWGAYECLGREPVQKEYETLSELNRRVRPDSSLPCLVEYFLPQQGRGRLVADQLCCGDSHVTVVVSATSRSIKSGIELYSWGNNSCGQLGINDRKVLQSFTPRSVNMKPIQVSKVDVKTAQKSSPAGTGDRSGKASMLSKISLVSGGRHMVLNLDGKLWTWGWNKFGQCGVGEMSLRQSCVHEPTKLHFALGPENVLDKHSNASSSSNRRKSTAQQEVDAAFDFGMSPIAPPQRGSGDGKTPDITDLSTSTTTTTTTKKDVLKEYTLNNPDIPEVIKSVHAGWKYSVCVTNKGKAFFWGSMALIPGVATMSLESQISQSSLGDIKAALYGTPGGPEIGTDHRDIGSGGDMSRGHGRTSMEQRSLDSLAQEADGLPIVSTPVQLVTDPDMVGFVEGVSGCSNSNASVLTICGIDPIARMEAMKFGNIARTKELAAAKLVEQAEQEEKETAVVAKSAFGSLPPPPPRGGMSTGLLKHPLRNKPAKKVAIKNTTANLLPRETKSSTLHSGFASVQRAEEMLAKAQEKAQSKVLQATSNQKLLRSRASYIGKQTIGSDADMYNETDSNTSSHNSKKAHRFSILAKERAEGESKRKTSSKSPPPPPSGTNLNNSANNNKVEGQVIGKRSSIVSTNKRNSIRASIGKDKTQTDLSINRADAIDMSRGMSHEERNERTPLMPHYHNSVRNPLERREISYRASTDEINRAFKNANLSSRINAAEFLNAKKKDEDAEKAQLLAEKKERARAKKRSSLRGAEESKSPSRSRGRDGDTLSQTSGSRRRRSKSPGTSIISSVAYDKATIARKVSSEAITDLLTMTPKMPDTDPFMDPSKPSYKAFARVRRTKARGVGMPQEDKKILMSLDFTNATSKGEEEDPFGLLAEFREKPKDQTVDSEFLSFVDNVLAQEESDTTRKQGGALAQDVENKKTSKVMDPQAERDAISTQRKQAYLSATGADNAESISKALFGGVSDSSTSSKDVNVDEYFAGLQAEINDLSNTDKESAAVSRMAKYKADSKSSRGKRATVAQLSRMAAFGSATYALDPLAKMQVSEVKALSSTIASLRLENKSQKPF
jgi:alpha-tubulin suppressor-like RCC1 family protein